MTNRHPEKRKEERNNAAMPVVLQNGNGLTRDMSVSGVYFWIDMPAFSPALGNSISFAVAITRPGGKMTIKCKGVVVRTEPRGSDLGVAVKIVETAEVLV